MQITREQSIQEIRRNVMKEMKSKTTMKLTDEEWMDLAKRATPWCECPANQNNRVEMVQCMFCKCGHMLECHYPKTCREANCSHYQRELTLMPVTPKRGIKNDN